MLKLHRPDHRRPMKYELRWRGVLVGRYPSERRARASASLLLTLIPDWQRRIDDQDQLTISPITEAL